MKAKDIRKGKVLMYNGAPHAVMDFQHRTPGNLRAFVQAKLRNLLNGSQTETRFSSTEEIETADVFNEEATFLYKDDMGFHFMHSQSYEQMTVNEELVGDSAQFLQDGMIVQVSIFNEQAIGLSLPKTVTLEVIETQPELKGSTATNSPKPATLDTGLVINVPAFVKIGDKIVVDTEEKKYLSRAD